MQRRCSVIDSAKPICTVSIHQNSYHEEGVHGAQAFYYSHSAEGKELAEMIQASLIGTVDPENHRVAKANDSYYLLKRTETPVVIVECGFLSNWVESAKLEDEYYQEKLAWAVHMADRACRYPLKLNAVKNRFPCQSKEPETGSAGLLTGLRHPLYSW